MDSELVGSLQFRLQQVFGGDHSVTNLHRLTGGASRETWAFTASQGDLHREMILRRDPPAAPDGARMALEAAVSTAAGAAEIPVPRIYDCSSANTSGAGLGSSYIIMERISGESLPRRLLRDDTFREIRKALPYELGRLLARLHQISGSQFTALPSEDPLEALFLQYTATGSAVPILELAFQWLRGNRVTDCRKALVHGDFRNGNLIINERGVAGVIDWELAHEGDPMEDLGWLCTKTWRFGSPEPVGGFGPREALFEGYFDECGVRPDPAAVRWWEVYGTLRWAVMCRVQAFRHLSGQEFSVELLAIGRRLAECEHDLFDELLASGRVRDFEYCRDPLYDSAFRAEVDSSNLYGSPTFAEMLTALTRYISELPRRNDEHDYLNRVAANVAKVVLREQIVGHAAEAAHAARLSQLGFRTEAELALALRESAVTADDSDVTDFMQEAIQARLLVANPAYR
ncbi:phosphotransferase [Mycolicibacterium sp. ELW1]|uniref:phosphotransferase family protein n=1 Tax=Mycobacteriaceae TaxID=1762 RepID=UPI0011EFA641|nr:phosphotransferase family protein [Mycobacterium sp. ELW1]QEN12947.1 phosphotransferase family protein [Mycobacterium sp. ELW1]